MACLMSMAMPRREKISFQEILYFAVLFMKKYTVHPAASPKDQL